MKKIDRIVDILIFILINIFVWIMCGSVVLQIVSRYVFNSPLSWTEEIARLCMVWMTFLGGAYLISMTKNGHIIVDALIVVLPKKLQTASKALGFVMMVALSIVLMVYGVQLIGSSMAMKLTATKLPIACLYASAPVSATFMMYYELRIVYGLLHSLFSKKSA